MVDERDGELAGQLAIVTGAARGIGRATALALARAGAKLAVCDRDGDALAYACEEFAALGVDFHAGALDVRDSGAVVDFVAGATAHLGKPAIVVNNAGGTFRTPFLELSAGGESALIDENFRSVTNLVRATAKLMTDGGSIINVTSIEAGRAAPGYAVYAAMKAAVENFTKSLALELADRAIRVNCVSPDAIATEGTGPIELDTPVGRAGTPEDVANAVMFLASPRAAFITGTTMHVDGGTAAAGGWHRGNDGEFEL